MTDKEYETNEVKRAMHRLYERDTMNSYPMSRPVRQASIMPKGQPDSGSSWSDPNPRLFQVLNETPDYWEVTPVANPNCPILIFPKFAWEEVTP